MRLPVRAVSSSADVPHVHLELLVPGDNLYSSDKLNDAGLYFKLEPGWHIYWKNPGDAGEPPHIQWTLPAGDYRRADAVSRAQALASAGR